MRIFGFAPIQKEAKSPLPIIRGWDFSSFKSDVSSVTEFNQFLNSPLGQSFISVLHNSIPSGYPIRGNPVSDTQANIELGHIQGFMECIQLIEALAQHTPDLTTPPEPDYGARRRVNNDVPDDIID